MLGRILGLYDSVGCGGRCLVVRIVVLVKEWVLVIVCRVVEYCMERVGKYFF